MILIKTNGTGTDTMCHCLEQLKQFTDDERVILAATEAFFACLPVTLVDPKFWAGRCAAYAPIRYSSDIVDLAPSFPTFNTDTLCFSPF